MKEAKSPDDWRTEEDMRILMEAEKIKKDSKRMKAAQACAKRKLETMQKIAEQ